MLPWVELSRNSRRNSVWDATSTSSWTLCLSVSRDLLASEAFFLAPWEHVARSSDLQQLLAAALSNTHYAREILTIALAFVCQTAFLCGRWNSSVTLRSSRGLASWPRRCLDSQSHARLNAENSSSAHQSLTARKILNGRRYLTASADASMKANGKEGRYSISQRSFCSLFLTANISACIIM